MKKIGFIVIALFVILSAKAQQVNIPYRMSGSNLMTVMVILNGQYQREFIWDTGATITVIPQSLFEVMYRSGDITDKDISSGGKATLADGSVCNVISVRLKSLSIGSFNYPNCEVNVIMGGEGSLLIGQNVMQKLGNISFDQNNKQIVCQGSSLPVQASPNSPLLASLNEVRLIPCSKAKEKEIPSIQNQITQSAIQVNSFTHEKNIPPKNAVDRITAEYVVRVFDDNDLAVAQQIEGLLIKNVKGEVMIENMIPYFKAPISGYIEIWIK